MSSIRCLVVADDLTGGGDTGAQFAAKGLRTLLATLGVSRRAPLDDKRWPVLVLNTHSRALAPRQAYQRVADLLTQLDLSRFEVIYKKIDSTLRGNIGSEIDALLEASPRAVGFLTPAFPAMGRTVENGILKVRGVPVAETEIFRDPVCPVTESHVVTLLQRQTIHRVGLVDLPLLRRGAAALREAVARRIDAGEKLLVFDCLERRDLAVIAELGVMLQPTPLFIGSAGLAEALATHVSARRSGRLAARPSVTPATHVVVVCGSASEVSRRQLAKLGQNLDLACVEIQPAIAYRRSAPARAARRTVTRTVAEALDAGSVILSVSRERMRGANLDERAVAQAVADALGRITTKAVSLSAIAPAEVAFVLTGGDTAMAVLQALGTEGVEIGSEPVEGIMAGRLRGGLCSDAQIITKAGAFGGDDALLRVMRMLKG
ncbi:MAG: four-carbon acid sugar kinase family protein [Desulfobacteraceae bacterium]|nr:MAG: four-carbon acid sugar kinase family protein [Desulfobacteraceae bacterium]